MLIFNKQILVLSHINNVAERPQAYVPIIIKPSSKVRCLQFHYHDQFIDSVTLRSIRKGNDFI